MENQRATQVESLLDVKRYDDAVKEALSALSSFPDSYYLQTLLIRAHIGAENNAEAEHQCKNLIKNFPQDAFSFYLASMVYHENKKFTSELECAQVAAKLEPDDGLYLKRLAEAQLQNGMIKAAKQSCESMIKLSPGDADSLELCGKISLELEDYKESEKFFREALRIEPDDIYCLNCLAISLRGQKREKEAIDILFVALRNRPDEDALKENLFNFIKVYLDRNTLKGSRSKILAELPMPIQMFYKDYKKRSHILERYSSYVMYVFWFLFIVAFAVLAEQFS